MKKLLLLFGALCFALIASAQDFSFAELTDVGYRWAKANPSEDYSRYEPDQFRQIADNVVAYQNEDGGWPKNLDMLSRLDPDSVVRSLKPRHRLSTLDNRNVYPQVEYLSAVYTLTRDTVYRDAARRGIVYMLDTQYSNGGWRGWDADAVTFNDGVIYGVLSAWLDVLYNKSCYRWIDDALKTRIARSWVRGVELVLRCQFMQADVKTVWAQQYDHLTLQPVGARAYELPGLTANESADIVMLLMRIRKPSPQVVEAVNAAVAWFERSKITGKKLLTVDVPEGLAEDPAIKKDRLLVDDPAAGPLWARFYDLDTNQPFFSDREGRKLSDMREVPAERRTGYAWYGTWGEKVLKAYPRWLRKIAKEQAEKAE